MKCFVHHDAEAIGACKYCFKGLCGVCAKDTGLGLACGPACEEELKALRAMIERNRKVYPLAARTHARNAIWFTVLAVMLIAFGRIAQRGFMSSYLIVFGIVMLLGAAFSAFNSRRMSKL